MAHDAATSVEVTLNLLRLLIPSSSLFAPFFSLPSPDVVAVPVYPPNPLKLSIDVPKLVKLVNDCGANLVLTSRDYYYGVVATTSLVQRLLPCHE